MELQYYGANCIKITNKKNSIVIDDNLSKLGGKSVATSKDIVLATGDTVLSPDARFTIDKPGEYEVADISVQGIAARAHMDEEKKMSATMYRLLIDGVRVVVLGHIYPELNDEQLEALGTVDILFIPVGGNGYTLDSIGAQRIIKDIEPRIVVPTHYDSSSLKYEVPQTPLEDAIKGLGMEVKQTLDSIKMKNFELGEGTELVVLNQA